MKRTQWMSLVGIAAGLLLLGCSGNEIQITNEAEWEVEFHFRGEEHSLAPGASTLLSDVPNGSYGYGTIFHVDKWLLVDPGNIEAGDGLSGTIDLYNRETNVNVKYFSSLFQDTTGKLKYVIDAAVTSDQSNP